MLAVYTGDDVAADGLGIPWQHAAQAARRLADVRAAAAAAGHRPGALRRRPGGDGGRRDPGPGQGRRRAGRVDYEPLPSVTDTADGRRSPARPRSGTSAPTTSPTLPRAGDKAATDAAFARAPQRDQAALRDHPRARPVHGAARRARRLRPGRGPLHALRRRAVSRTACATCSRSNVFKIPRAPDPGHRGRRRRRLRHQGLAIRRAPARAVGGAQARAAGEVALRAARGDPGRRARARQRRPTLELALDATAALPRAARATRSPTSAPMSLRPQPARHVQQCRHPRRRLHVPGRPRRGPLRADQHQLRPRRIAARAGRRRSTSSSG